MTRSLQKSPAKERLPLLLSFALPFVIAYVALFIAGLWPAGDGQALAHDGWHQYYPFFRAYREKLLHGGSLQYTWDIGAGMGYSSLFAYYLASPLNLLALLTPERLLRELFAFLTVLKLALAGLSFGCFLKIVYRKNDLAIPFFALLYAFCAWASGYYWNLMWLDAFALLPLLVAGTVCLLREGKFRLYVGALALSLWCNYYIAFFCCIFILLCFIGFCLICWNGWKGFSRRFLRIGICTLLGAGIAAVLLLPTLMAMQTTYSATAKEFSPLALNIAKDASGAMGGERGVWEVLRSETLPGLLSAMRQILAQLMPPPEITKMTGLPNIFCGYCSVILAIYYCCCKKIKLREKIFNVLLLFFLALSFCFRALDYIWHGFHFPNMLPYRFSLLFSFVLIAMAYRAWRMMDGFRPRHLFFIVPVAALLLVNLIGKEAGENAFLLGPLGKSGATLLVWILSGAVLAGMLVFFLLYFRRRKKLATFLLFAVMSCEAVLSFAAGVNKIGMTTRSVYPKQEQNVQALLDYIDTQDAELFWRAEVTNTQTLNDPALNGYHGVSVFSSSANVNFNRFSRALGLSSWPGSNRYAYYEGTPFANTMLGVKYILDRDGEHRNKVDNTLVASAGDVNLLKNSAYISLGFMTDSKLAEFVCAKTDTDAIGLQAELFRLATGIEAPLYSHLVHSELRSEDNLSFTAEPNGTRFNYSTKGAEQKSEFSVSYDILEDGLFCASTKLSNANDVTVYRNDERQFSRNVKASSVFSIGYLRAGDKLTFRYSIDRGKSGSITLDVAKMNRDAFQAGMETLKDEAWTLTEFSDTLVRGTITAKTDGLFYTSIPYEPGWTATVDGKSVALAAGYDPQSEDVALTDAVIAFPLSAGTHEIVLTYCAPGLKLGALISVVCLLAFILLLLLLRRKHWLLLPPPERERWQPPADEPEEDEAAPADTTDAAEDTRALPLAAEDDVFSDDDLFSRLDALLGEDVPARAVEPAPETPDAPPAEDAADPVSEDSLFSRLDALLGEDEKAPDKLLGAQLPTYAPPKSDDAQEPQKNASESSDVPPAEPK